MEETLKIKEELNKQLEEHINKIIQEGIQPDNVIMLGKLVDIHKDLANEDYWETKKGVMDMRYREYNDYGRDDYGRRGRDSRGRYRGRGNSRYNGEEMLDEMMEHYQNYSTGKEMYGNDMQTLESFKYMVKSFKDYYKHLKENASSQEEVQILDEAIDEMARM